MRTPSSITLALAVLAVFAGSLPAQATREHRESQAVRPAAATPTYGVLVMAHGGSPDWNASVEAAVRPLGERYPTEIAFGMADATTMEQAVRRLEARGVETIGVVRLFISRDSWLERTEQIFGLRAGAPARPTDDHSAHGGHSMGFWRIDTPARIAVGARGLSDDDAMGEVLATRARTLSRAPAQEEVLIIAHGPGDDAENERWVAAMERQAQAVRTAAPFAAVHVATLREDWPDKRAAAESRIRALVTAADSAGRAMLVIPYRLSGMGPYAKVLGTLPYRADGVGLVPHGRITQWLLDEAEAVKGRLVTRVVE